MTTTAANRTERQATADAIEQTAGPHFRRDAGRILEVVPESDGLFGVSISAGFDVLADEPQSLIADSLRRLADALNAAADDIENL